MMIDENDKVGYMLEMRWFWFRWSAYLGVMRTAALKPSITSEAFSSTYLGIVRTAVVFVGIWMGGVVGGLAQHRVTNEMIYQQLIEIRKQQAVFDERFQQIEKRFELIEKQFELIDKRFEDINKRFEDINKRFEDINHRFEDINRRFENLTQFLWILSGIFTTLVAVVIGFAYWDRRTIIAEARRQTIEELEREVKPERLRRLLTVVRQLAKEDERLQELLRKEGLL